MDAPQLPSSFLSAWSAALADQQMAQRNDFPSYHIDDPVSALVTSCQPRTITTGTGASIFKETLLPALSQARREIILVTCFWAESETLQSLRETLENMAARREAERTRWGAAQRQNPENRLRISLCFSSSGVLQKLLHPQSTRGRVYQPKEWQGLGLPSADTLSRGGIDLTVKSLFFLPFSVMHPKFLLVDRERAWMPSCNVSWESWFETCIEFEGPAVGALLAFHESVWSIHNAGDYKDTQDVDETNDHVNTRDSDHFPPPGPIEHRNSATGAGVENMTSHNAQKHIEIMTPNLTSDPAIEALLDALQRGVDVTLRTSRNMMTVEQLVTAGTTTAWKLKAMVARYRKMQTQRYHAQSSGPLSDIEGQQTSGLGKLEIYYYKSNKYALTQPGASLDEPVLAHAKVVLVDNEYMILGSGNMDRASWFTSQELGILLYMPGFSSDVWRTPLESRQECIWESGTE
ncbi:cardiolipin synthetase [Ceratocystis platani]|uniref:Cardiolipin synthetase n=1 Tax=Ceratocystis fimbriata f. sp. platani TaxID=88771 RepID=A0A0F8B3X9_CERFI|nr:cardiolipin synthetase [Ceratocystis platani]